MRLSRSLATGLALAAAPALGGAAFAQAAAQAPATQPAAPTTAAAAGLKFAYLNSQLLLQQAPGRAEAEAQFEREMAAYQQQVKRMGDSLNALVADYNKQELTLSPSAKETRQKSIRDREEAYQKRTQDLEQQARARQDELVQPILQQINVAIQQVRAEGGYTFIFDVGNSAGIVVAADTTLDITDVVMAKLKTMGPAKPTTAARPAGTPATPANRPSTGPSLGAPAGVTRPATRPPTR
ncbi:MAG TPA: OmpH family outer membrane protein [Gemmatimonadaceae bacterium]|nr:OmpH family outer membrane protein [Gemmatimonadaceae bacterium]